MKFTILFILTSLLVVQSMGNTFNWFEFNGNFEIDQNIDGFPDGWKTWKKNKFSNDIDFVYDQREAYSGRRSVKIVSTGNNSASFSLKKDLKLNRDIHEIFRAQIYMKTEDCEGVIWVDFYTINSDGEKTWRNAVIYTGGTHDWKEFSLDFACPSDAQKINILLAIQGKGIVWFDEINLSARRSDNSEKIILHGQTFYNLKNSIPVFGSEIPLFFIPSDPDRIFDTTNSLSEDEFQKSLFSAIGERESFTFGLYVPSNDDTLILEKSDLSSSTGIISRERINILKVHYWNQRRGWNSFDYYNIPELLLDIDIADSFPSHEKFIQYWVTILVPENIEAGTYKGQVSIKSNSLGKRLINIDLEVLPFRLVEPPQRWGLYVDSHRWVYYSTEEIKLELLKIRKHGITNLLLNDINFEFFTFNDGNIKLNNQELNRYLILIKECGFPDPVILSVQKLEGYIRNLLKEAGESYDQEMLENLYKNIISELAFQQKVQNWPDIALHVIDEPRNKSPEVRKNAQRYLEIIKDNGFKTFTTMNDLEIGDPFVELIDLVCYHKEYATQTFGQNERVIQIMESLKKPFWWYGSGCYEGQEGKIYPNRYLTGVLFWKSGAESIWSWTFQRTKGDPFDDFDCKGLECKDACITYPTKSGKGFISTLQWEGIHEGIIDFKYLATLENYINQSGKSENDSLRYLSRETQKWMMELESRIPWQYSGELNNLAADSIRWKIARKIIDLKQRMK